jgi:hypothetical protein
MATTMAGPQLIDELKVLFDEEASDYAAWFSHFNVLNAIMGEFSGDLPSVSNYGTCRPSPAMGND